MGHNYLFSNKNRKIGEIQKLHQISDLMAQTASLYLNPFRNDKQNKIATSNAEWQKESHCIS